MLAAVHRSNAGQLLERFHAPIEIVDAEQDVIDVRRRRTSSGRQANRQEDRNASG
jgi:hypothetical protein